MNCNIYNDNCNDNNNIHKDKTITYTLDNKHTKRGNGNCSNNNNYCNDDNDNKP